MSTTPGGQLPRHGLLTFIHRHAFSILISPLLFLLTFSLQYLSGAWQKELAHADDEPAHVVAALMIHDYLAMGMPESPQRYAERYYAHYPKLAIGWWPPLLYMVAALWMFPIGVSRFSLLLLSSALVAALSSGLALFARRLYGPILGVTAGVMFIALHSTQIKNGQFMLDIAVGLASFGAMMLMEQYFRTEQLAVAVALGFVISGAMLVKGNANALVLMIGFMVLTTGRIDLLKKRGLYIVGLIVLVIGLPWQILTLELKAQQHNVVPLNLEFVAKNTLGYTEILIREFTPLVWALLLVGLVVAAWRARAKTTGEELSLAAVACLFLATVVFHIVVPVIGSLDSRYITAALAPGIILFLAGCQDLARFRLPAGASPALRVSLLVGYSLISAAYLGAFRAPNLPALGFTRVADVALATDGACCTMLICSDSVGEGAFISEVALRDRNLSRIILRGSKLISESPWNDQTFRMLFHNDTDLARSLDANAVDVVVVDLTETNAEQARALLLASLGREPHQWNVTNLQGQFTRAFNIYTRKDRSGLKRDTIRVPMPFTLGRSIELQPQ